MIAASQAKDAVTLMESEGAAGSERRDLVFMVARIGAIVFFVEAVIMVMLSGWRLTPEVVKEGLLDAALLTVLSTPLIYLWVALPFVRSARSARHELSLQLDERRKQAAHLEEALAKSQALLTQNESLRQSLQRAGKLAAQSNEQILQRIGGDLHDGPAQLLAFAMMRFGRITSAFEAGDMKRGKAELASVRAALSDTLREIRDISTGLAPPGITTASLATTIAQVIALHEQHTGTSVRSEIDALDCSYPEALKMCVYRFVQEALSNAYRHAGGVGQVVIAKQTPQRARCISIAVSDAGPGFCPSSASPQRLGLAGMRARIEALGGDLKIESDPIAGGTKLTATFDLAAINVPEMAQ